MESNNNPVSANPDPVVSRRRFLGLAGGGALLLLVGADAVKAAGPSAELVALPYDWTKHSWLYVIDTRKCIGCGSCVRACRRENDVPAHYFRTWVERYLISYTGEVSVDSPQGAAQGFDPVVPAHDVSKAFFVPKLCNHCTNSPCVQLCPVGASYRTKDGLVLVDEKRCMGCGYCVQACPFGSRFLNPETHIASKCTLCYHRITKGLRTACVEVCPVGARMLGDSKAVGNKVAEIVATERVSVLKPELLTEPNCFYLGLDKGVR
jgi:Fe-S-cluster-containing dehydrogenase component